MEIEYGVQVDPSAITEKHIDLFIVAGNHEKRVFTCLDYMKRKNSIGKVLLLCFSEGYSGRKDFDMQKLTVRRQSDIFSVLDDFFLSIESQSPILYVDYSCMTKSWYYAIIQYLSHRQLKFCDLTVYFSYTPSKFSVPKQPKHNTEIAPLAGKYIVPTDKPKALIVCLGYEQNKAEGVIHHLDPKLSYIFYTKPALDDRFVEVLERNNEYILANFTNITTFKFDDLLFLERELTALYFSLRDDYSVIIAPLGPKPFTFISMLLSVRYHDIDIWRVGSGSDINRYVRAPLAQDCFIVSEMHWIN